MPHGSPTTWNFGNYWSIRRVEETRKLEIACGRAKARRLIKEIEQEGNCSNDRTWAEQLMKTRNKILTEGTNDQQE